MAETLRLKLEIEGKDALIDVKALKVELDKLAKASQNKPKIDPKPYKLFREQAALAASTTTQLGRQLDRLSKKYGSDSEQVRRFTQEQLKANSVAKIQKAAILDLKKALDSGAISQHKYALEAQRLAKNQSLFLNKMTGATPIRRISSDLRQVGSLLSSLSPMFGGTVGYVADFSDKLMDARTQLGGTAEGLRGLGVGAKAATTGFSSMLPVLGALLPILAAVATAMAGVFLVKKGFDLTKDFIKAGQEVEKIEKNLAGLINASTVFKNVNGEAVTPMENLNASMEHSKLLFKALQKEAVALAGLTTQDLLAGATFGIPQLAQLGITDAEKQAKTLGTLTAAIKQLGYANNEIQQKVEVRAFLGGDVKKQGADFAKLVAQVNGGTEAFTRNYEEAKKNGEMYEFLTQALQPFANNQKLAADSIDNNFSVIQDGLDRTYQEVGRKLTPSFKELQLQLIEVLFEDGPNGTVVFNTELQKLTDQIGVELAGSISELKPLIKPAFEAMVQGAALSVKALVKLLQFFNKVTQEFRKTVAFAKSVDNFVKSGALDKVLFGKHANVIGKQAARPGAFTGGRLGEDIGADIATRFGSSKLTDRPSTTNLQNLIAGSKTTEDLDEKGAKKAEREAKAAARKAEKLREQLHRSKELRVEAEKSLEVAMQQAEEQQKQLKFSKDILIQEQAIAIQKQAYTEEASNLQFEIDKINLLKQSEKLTDIQAENLIYQNKLSLIENKYAQDEVDIAKEKIKLQEYENKLSEIKNKSSIEEAGKQEEIARVQSKRQELLGGREEGQLGLEEQSALNKLEASIAKLNEELIKIQTKATTDITKAQENISTQTTKIEGKTEARSLEKERSTELLNLQHTKTMEDNAKKQKNALIEGGKAISNDIKNAFSDGELTLEEAFGIFENILNKAKDMFKSGGAMEGGGFLSGLGPLFGGSNKQQSTNYDSSTLARGADGVFTAFNNLTGQTESLGTSCGKAAKSAVGLGENLGGLGGLLSNLGSGGAGLAIGGITTALSIGQTVFSFFSARKKKKKQEKTKRKIKQVEKQYKNAMYSLSLMEKDFEKRMDDFSKSLSEINREIRKIDVNTSLFLGQKVIEKTSEQIQKTIDMIGKGTSLLIQEEVGTGYVFAVQNLGAEATGLYQERNNQIIQLMQHQQYLWAQIAAGASGDYGDKVEEQIGAISERIKEINDNFNNQIDQMTEQREDLLESLEKAREQQKTNFIEFMKRVDKAKAEVQFGEGAGNLYDQMIETVTQIREVMLSGIDPKEASFLIARLREKAENNLRNQYRDFIEGTNNSYLASISAIQDDLFNVISEGRVTGKLKRTQGDRLAEIQSRIEKLRDQSVADSTLSLEEFGLTTYEATNALETMIDMLNKKTLEATQQLQLGQYREIDAININTVFDPAILAAQIRDEINKQMSTPSLTTVPLV